MFLRLEYATLLYVYAKIVLKDSDLFFPGWNFDGPFPWKGRKLCIFHFRMSHDKLFITNLAYSSRTGDYWPSLILVQTSLH